MCVKHPLGTPLKCDTNSSNGHWAWHVRSLFAETLSRGLDMWVFLFEIGLEAEGYVGVHCRGE